jgi:hypothetical protein
MKFAVWGLAAALGMVLELMPAPAGAQDQTRINPRL